MTNPEIETQRQQEQKREQVKQLPKQQQQQLNANPKTGETGTHPVGTGVGAVGGAATGAAVGATTGPIGAVVGGTIGAVVGGLVGKTAAEAENPTEGDEDIYWREHSQSQPYYTSLQHTHPDLSYERDYQAAYRVGYAQRSRYEPGTRFEDVEPDLRSEWESTKGDTRLVWEDAKHAVRDAWNRMTR